MSLIDYRNYPGANCAGASRSNTGSNAAGQGHGTPGFAAAGAPSAPPIEIAAAPIISNGVLYLLADNGSYYTLTLETENGVTTTDIGQSPVQPPFNGAGSIALLSNDLTYRLLRLVIDSDAVTLDVQSLASSGFASVDLVSNNGRFYTLSIFTDGGVPSTNVNQIAI